MNKKHRQLLFALLIVLSMVLGACAQTAEKSEAPAEATEVVVVETQPPAEEVVTEAAVETQPPAEEPTAEPVATEAEDTEPDLDGAFAALLENMVAYNTIKPDALLAEMVEDTPPFLLDVRTAAEVEESGHIPSAVNIPLAELAQHVDLLPAFDTPIVVYCGTGWRATIGMTALSALGWENVRALKTTFAGWVDAGNPVEEGGAEPGMVLNAAQPDAALLAAVDDMLTSMPKGFGGISAEDFTLAMADNPDMVIIDVRKDAELEEGGIIDSGDIPQIHIPLEDFINRKADWVEDKDADIVVYCGSGHRSTMAMTILWTYGYQNVKSLKGGYGGWVKEGYPVLEYAAP